MKYARNVLMAFFELHSNNCSLTEARQRSAYCTNTSTTLSGYSPINLLISFSVIVASSSAHRFLRSIWEWCKKSAARRDLIMQTGKIFMWSGTVAGRWLQNDFHVKLRNPSWWLGFLKRLTSLAYITIRGIISSVFRHLSEHVTFIKH